MATGPNTRPEHRQLSGQTHFPPQQPEQHPNDLGREFPAETPGEHPLHNPLEPADHAAIEAAARAAQGTLSGHDTFRFLADQQDTGRLSKRHIAALRQAGNARPVDRAQLSEIAEALTHSASDAAARLNAAGASKHEIQALSTRAKEESSFIILAKSEFQRDYGPWLQYQDAINGPFRQDSQHQHSQLQDSLRDIVNHRVHHISQEPITMPAKLDQLHEELINLENGVIPQWYNPDTMTVSTGESDHNANWLIPKEIRRMDPSEAAEYLHGQLASHGVGTTGETDPATFAVGLVDPHVDLDLAAQWRTSPTSYNTPPRNPIPNTGWDDPQSHAQATYAWLLRDALSPDWLPRQIWLSNTPAIVAEANEKNQRLEDTAEFLKDLTGYARNPAFRSAYPPDYTPLYRWDQPEEHTWRSILNATEDATDMDPLWKETQRIHQHLTLHLNAAQPDEPSLHPDHPRALLLQESVCNLDEVRLSLYKITLEQTDRQEKQNAALELVEDLHDHYRQRNMEPDYIQETAASHRAALLDPPHVTEASRRYVLAELRSVASRLTHIDFNLRAVHSLSPS